MCVHLCRVRWEVLAQEVQRVVDEEVRRREGGPEADEPNNSHSLSHSNSHGSTTAQRRALPHGHREDSLAPPILPTSVSQSASQPRVCVCVWLVVGARMAVCAKWCLGTHTTSACVC
jgi:hypothetical protein